MSSHQLAIAKASFSAGLLRPDPTSLAREDIARFHSLLNSTVIQCTPVNVQKSKQWIFANLAQSTARFTALGKYLTALAASFTEKGPFLDSSSTREPSIKRKRLHILYLVNDVLHHAKYQINDASICGKLQPILMSLFTAAASFKDCPKQHQKIVELLSIWEEKGYYSADYIDKLRETVKHASELGALPGDPLGGKIQESTVKTNKSAPFVMPAMHGDPATPWFDLPAGNLMPHILPNSTRPINPDMIKPLQYVAGPADEGLVLAVKGLLDDVQKIFGVETDQDEKLIWDIDELGQSIILDEITGEVLEGEGYYGWSRTFCEKMKRRRKGLEMPGLGGSQDRQSRSRSSSPGIKRRRYARADDRTSPVRRRTSHARHSPRSGSHSSSPRDNRSRSYSRSSSRSRSYSRSPQRARESPRPDDMAREARPIPTPPERPYDIPQKPPGPFIQQPSFHHGFNGHVPPPPPPPAHPMPYNIPHGASYSMPQSIPYGVPYNDANQTQYGSWAPPPAPLHSYPNAQWPPPPPPLPPPPGPPPFQQQAGGYAQPGSWNPQMQANMAAQGGWQSPMQPSDGRGINNSRWNNNGPQGRGERGNYRGRGW